MNIKNFQCCGTNEFLISRSEAKNTIRAFREELNSGLIDYSMIFGFCISCGDPFDFNWACNQKGFDFAHKFYEMQLKRTNSSKYSHKLRKAGGFSKKFMQDIYKNQYFDQKSIIRMNEKQIQAIISINNSDQ
jgi:hypothetical protein